MSTPRLDYEDKQRGAALEIISAESALNMLPDPIECTIREEHTCYISHRDGWVAHAMEHLHAAFALLNNIQKL